eukprot:GHUV01009530.1.p1 GENE.GHUV01009530.1~~GHUV01009530.1.p1  ORF type:complete len:323 (+),score=71.46 GHUV01009530.1:172-1140(+)
MAEEQYTKRLWLEEDLADDLKWSMLVKQVLYSGKSKYQEVDLIDVGPFGKTLFLDGKVQSSEVDEWVYHELLVHPAMVMHPNPKTVFICGGGEGATAREVLRHKSVEKVVMVDIDKVVCDFCHAHLEKNKAAFESPKLELINDDARTQLEQYPGKFDVIIGDLADPLDGGPCYQLYTQDFYQQVVLQKLNPGGIFITQSGPAGFLSCTEVFTCINATLRSVFPKVLPYTQHMPVFCDVWGWNMALTDPSQADLSPEDMDARLAERVEEEMRFLDGHTFRGLCHINKHVRKCLQEETQLYTEDCGRFIHGKGSANGTAEQSKE